MKFLTIVLYTGFFMASLTLIHCKNDHQGGQNSNTNIESAETNTNSKVNNSGVIHSDDIQRILPEAQSKGKEHNDHAWAMVTADMWHYDFAIMPDTTPKKNVFEGDWIDFKDDYTYLKGHYQDTTEAGYYIFDFDNDKRLEIIPLSGGESASSWRLLTNGEVTIMIGTAKYNSKGWQIKLVRAHTKPSAPKG